MKLYWAPGACSLADLIALLEAGFAFDDEAVDLHTKRTASGSDYRQVNPKGYVPALVLDDGQVVTENIAVLDWIADQHPSLRPDGALGRTRLLEMLTFISTEIHRAFKPMWHGGDDAEKQKARETAAQLFQLAANLQRGQYLLGDALSVADCYLLVMLRWAERFGVAVPEALLRLQWRMEQRPAVQAAVGRHESTAPRERSLQVGAGVRENPERHRFERPIHATAAAVTYYRTEGGKLLFTHTETPTGFSGLGIATELARGTFELLRESQRKAVLICPFMMHYFTKHPEYADVVDSRMQTTR